jgi:hypothetical protein
MFGKSEVVKCDTPPPSRFSIVSGGVFSSHLTMKSILANEWLPHYYPGDNCLKENQPRRSKEEAMKWCNDMYQLGTIEQKVLKAEKTLVKYRELLPKQTKEDLKDKVNGKDIELEEAIKLVRKNQPELEADLKMRLEKLKK